MSLVRTEIYIFGMGWQYYNGVSGKLEHQQYIPIESNNIYAKFGAVMTKIMEAI